MLRVTLSAPSRYAPFCRNRDCRLWAERKAFEAFLVQDRLCASDVIHRGLGDGYWP